MGSVGSGGVENLVIDRCHFSLASDLSVSHLSTLAALHSAVFLDVSLLLLRYE